MDILILDSWIREHLETTAKPEDIARCLSLCGPSIEKIETLTQNGKKDYVYHIEVTTNRVDMMSVRGIAREAAVILPEFGFKANLLNLLVDKAGQKFKDGPELIIKPNPKLEDRLMGVILDVSVVTKPPEFIKERLEASGIRSLKPIVDITNYVMTEVGHPTHVFDYDLVKPLMRIRESKKGEVVESFDGKKYKLPGGDIVIDNGRGEIIDLPGIVGTKNSVVNESTKRILFFTDTNDPVKIRKTSMTLSIRTVAATLNEKGVDPNLAEVALRRGLYLYKNALGAKQLSDVYDLYSNVHKSKTIRVPHEFIEKILGIPIETKRVLRILNDLGIATSITKAGEYNVTPPSHRSRDITIPEDVVEEVARIFGYHNLPSRLTAGFLPEQAAYSPFKFETTVKEIIKGSGGVEVYTLSMVAKENLDKGSPSLKIKNPLGTDAEYLRTSLMASLVNAVNENKGEKAPFHMFEMANIYVPKTGSLPEEKMMLSGIFSNFDYRVAKGIIDHLLSAVNIDFEYKTSEERGFLPNQCLNLISGTNLLGRFGVLEESSLAYYELDMAALGKLHKTFPTYVPESKYPGQVEDVTLVFPERTVAGSVIATIKNEAKEIVNLELKGIYNNAYTFTIAYQSQDKTLENSEIANIRESFIKKLAAKFGIIQK